MFEQWQKNPASVDVTWQKYFQGGSASNSEIFEKIKGL